jgi:hypothetical protein
MSCSAPSRQANPVLSLWGDTSTRRSCSYPYPRTPTIQHHSRCKVQPKQAGAFVDALKEELVSQGRRHAALKTLPPFGKRALRLLVPQGLVALPKCVHSVSDRCYRYTSGMSRFPPPRHQCAPTTTSRNVLQAQTLFLDTEIETITHGAES